MKNLVYRIVKFLDCYIGPLFINGRKQDDYFKRMQEKYPQTDEHRTDSKN
jgi:hypothetical protein